MDGNQPLPPANGTPDVDVTKLEGFDSSWVDCGDRLKESEACTPIGVPVRSFVSRVRRSSEPAAVSCDGTPLGAKPAADSKGAWVVPAAEFDAKCGKARRLTLRVGADERSIPIDGRVREAAR